MYQFIISTEVGMELFNDIIGAVFLGGATLVGIAVIIRAVYDRFFRTSEPDSSVWGKTKAFVVGSHTYSKRFVSRMHDTTVDITEPLIVYYVDGKEYNKSIPHDTDDGRVDIYYKRSNPSFFRTADEVSSAYHSGRKNSHFIFMMFWGVIITVIAGVPFVTIYIIQ